MKDFSWSPSQNIIAYWVPEDDNSPARVCLMELPSRKEIRVKNLFNVHDVSFYQSNFPACFDLTGIYTINIVYLSLEN